MKRLILTDVCDTLIDLNSTYDYIKFLCVHNYGNRFLGNLLNNYYFRLLSFMIFKITRYDFHRKLTFWFFKNMKKSDLKDINRLFWEYYISKKTKILDLMVKYIQGGEKVMLVSASINPPIDMLGKYLGIDYSSSKLEEINGIYTGKVKNDLLGNKECLLYSKELSIGDYDEVDFYTDNLSDIGFIKTIQNLSKNSKFYLILKSEKIKDKRLKLLYTNNIKNYEFIS